jgi:hypothetical protein
MSITLNTVVFDYDSQPTPNKCLYVSGDNTFSSKDQLALGRTSPKPTATYAGNARSEVKRTKTVTLADGSEADAIVTVSVSLPVGISSSDAAALCDDVGDFLISGDALTLVYNHDINY